MSAAAIPSVVQLKKAIKLAEQIQKLESELAGLLGQTPASARELIAKAAEAGGFQTKTRRSYNFSPEARARIAAAQKARWERQRQQKEQPK